MKAAVQRVSDTRHSAVHRTHGRSALQDAFTDETDGPLDLEKKRQFMRMKREVLKQGGLEGEFFISHTSELVEEADAVIDVEALAA
jgi:DNA repair protein SbcC/Rad50